MNFKPLTLQDIERVRPYFDKVESNTCDYSVGGMFMWRDYFKMEFAIEDGAFFSRLHTEALEPYYNLPVSEDIPASLKKLIESERKTGENIKFCTIPEYYLPLFSECCQLLSVTEQPEFFDYLYAAEDLTELKGRRFSGQRNQMSQFRRNVGDWDFVPIDENNIQRVTDFFLNFHEETAPEGSYEQEENAKVLEVLQNMDVYGMRGGYLTADGRIVGFCLGETIHDTLYMHIEKADRQYKGAYQMLVNQGALLLADEGVRYINREEAMGDPGLKTAKEAYHPIALLKKYVVEAR